MLEFIVPGVPVPQGSMSFFGPKQVKYRDDLKPWRLKVNQVFNLTHRGKTIEGAVELRAVFVMPRPKSHYGTGRNAGRIREACLDLPHTARNDVDKLTRAICDALSTTKDQVGAYTDDAYVVRIAAEKRYVRPGEWPHAQITLLPALGTT